MENNPLLQSINAALAANATLGLIYDAIYTKDDPGCIVTAAYRNALRAITAGLQETNKKMAVTEAMHELRNSLRSSVTDVLTTAQIAGIENAITQLKYYKITAPGPVAPAASFVNTLSVQLNTAVAAIVSNIESQAATVSAILAAELDTELIIGTSTSAGIVKPGGIGAGIIFWAGSLFADAFGSHIAGHGQGYGFQKQAVAALDQKTTDCCLRVHGQIQPLNREFVLTGHPRFADKLDWSPFHWNCRTSIALYLPQYDNGYTTQMQTSAQTILDEHAAGIYTDRGPSSAFI